MGVADEMLLAMKRLCIASIGPTCSDALREHGLQPNIEASPPRMGPMIRDAIDAWLHGTSRRRTDGGSP
jgi:uroporphyrinogen-III synthase